MLHILVNRDGRHLGPIPMIKRANCSLRENCIHGISLGPMAAANG